MKHKYYRIRAMWPQAPQIKGIIHPYSEEDVEAVKRMIQQVLTSGGLTIECEGSSAFIPQRKLQRALLFIDVFETEDSLLA